MESNKQFKIRPDAFAEIKRQAIRRAVPILVLALAGGMTIGFFANGGEVPRNWSVLILIPVMLAALGYGLFRGVKLQLARLQSYQLSFENGHIIRTLHDTPTISIPYQDVKEITRHAKGAIMIQGNKSWDQIAVPQQIEGGEEVSALLSGIRPIVTLDTIPFFQKYRIVYSMFLIALMAAVYISKDKTIVGICGALWCFIFGYSLYQIQQSKNVDSRTKNGIYALLLIMMSVIGVMYFKIFGN